MQEFNGELEIYSLNENVNNVVIKILKRENEPVFGLINIKEKDKKILDKMVSNIFSCKLRSYDGIETIMKDLTDSWIDAYSEELGTKYTPDFCKWLRDIPLTSSNYKDCAIELMHGLKKILNTKNNALLPAQKRAFINHFIDGYLIWANSF